MVESNSQKHLLVFKRILNKRGGIQPQYSLLLKTNHFISLCSLMLGLSESNVLGNEQEELIIRKKIWDLHGLRFSLLSSQVLTGSEGTVGGTMLRPKSNPPIETLLSSIGVNPTHCVQFNLQPKLLDLQNVLICKTFRLATKEDWFAIKTFCDTKKTNSIFYELQK